MKVNYNFSPEYSFPSRQPRSYVVEDKIIPFLPNAPSCNGKQIHEVGAYENFFLKL